MQLARTALGDLVADAVVLDASRRLPRPPAAAGRRRCRTSLVAGRGAGRRARPPGREIGGIIGDDRRGSCRPAGACRRRTTGSPAWFAELPELVADEIDAPARRRRACRRRAVPGHAPTARALAGRARARAQRPRRRARPRRPGHAGRHGHHRLVRRRARRPRRRARPACRATSAAAARRRPRRHGRRRRPTGPASRPRLVLRPLPRPRGPRRTRSGGAHDLVGVRTGEPRRRSSPIGVERRTPAQRMAVAARSRSRASRPAGSATIHARFVSSTPPAGWPGSFAHDVPRPPSQPYDPAAARARSGGGCTASRAPSRAPRRDRGPARRAHGDHRRDGRRRQDALPRARAAGQQHRWRRRGSRRRSTRGRRRRPGTPAASPTARRPGRRCRAPRSPGRRPTQRAEAVELRRPARGSRCRPCRAVRRCARAGRRGTACRRPARPAPRRRRRRRGTASARRAGTRAAACRAAGSTRRSAAACCGAGGPAPRPSSAARSSDRLRAVPVLHVHAEAEPERQHVARR